MEENPRILFIRRRLVQELERYIAKPTTEEKYRDIYKDLADIFSKKESFANFISKGDFSESDIIADYDRFANVADGTSFNDLIEYFTHLYTETHSEPAKEQTAETMPKQSFR